MVSSVKDVVMAGMGLARIGREDVEKIFDELKKRGEAEEKSREEFIRRIVKKLERRGNNVEIKIKRTARRVLKTAHGKIAAMNKRIDEMVKELKETRSEDKKSS
jgi:polyhydroxyalkanoate synthesis regulator phasin